eukprot:354927-Chlamydomonas_euryale.AAC.1
MLSGQTAMVSSIEEQLQEREQGHVTVCHRQQKGMGPVHVPRSLSGPPFTPPTPGSLHLLQPHLCVLLQPQPLRSERSLIALRGLTQPRLGRRTLAVQRILLFLCKWTTHRDKGGWD